MEAISVNELKEIWEQFNKDTPSKLSEFPIKETIRKPQLNPRPTEKNTSMCFGMDSCMETTTGSESGPFGPQSTEESEFSIEERYIYRYCKVTLRGQDLLAKKSCKTCYGTGVYGQRMDPKTKQKQTVFCQCLRSTDAT